MSTARSASRLTCVACFLLASVLVAVSLSPVAAAAAEPGKPDLAIRDHRFRLTSECRPRRPVMEVTITVENKGTVPWPGHRTRPTLQVMTADGVNWGNSARLGALAPGEQRTLTVQVYFFVGDPEYMTARASHPFVIELDPFDLVEEADETNNTSATFDVPPPTGCL